MTSMHSSERLGSYLKRAEQALNSAKSAALKPAGLTVPQYGALMFLIENPGINAAALARLCGVTPPTMNTILTNLQDRGLIERTPHAWHKNVLETRLTEAGAALVAEADVNAVRVERTLAAEFSEAEHAALRDLLTRCADLLDSIRPESAPKK